MSFCGQDSRLKRPLGIFLVAGCNSTTHAHHLRSTCLVVQYPNTASRLLYHEMIYLCLVFCSDLSKNSKDQSRVASVQASISSWHCSKLITSQLQDIKVATMMPRERRKILQLDTVTSPTCLAATTLFQSLFLLYYQHPVATIFFSSP